SCYVSIWVSSFCGRDYMITLGSELKQVPHHTEVGDLKDRSVFVFVDGDNSFSGLHPGQVLNRTGDAHGDIQIRRDRNPGLAHLEVVRHIAGIYSGTGSTDGSVELIGQIFYKFEILLGTDAAATRNHYIGGRQRRPVGCHLNGL